MSANTTQTGSLSGQAKFAAALPSAVAIVFFVAGAPWSGRGSRIPRYVIRAGPTQTIRDMIKRKELTAVRVNERLRISRSEVTKLIALTGLRPTAAETP